MWKTIGQKRTIALLQAGLERGTLAHAYLFVGPAHVGKMTLARDLACALNCNSTLRPCGECSSCRKILASKHADVQEIGLGRLPGETKTKTEISIDEVRSIQHAAVLPPYEGKCRFFIVDGAELLSVEAANCLLKTLEEPLPGVVFLLLTANEAALPETVASRCQRVELVPLPTAEVEAALVEKWKVAPETARRLARLSHGCLGWAVSATDSGVLGRYSDCIDALVEAIDGNIEVRFAYAGPLATEFSQNRESVQDKLELWVDWWHDLMLVKTGLESLVTNVDRLETLTRMSREMDLAQIIASIRRIQEAGERLRLNANARLALEVMVLGLPTVGLKIRAVKK
jgi:DNA polymerase-3 subunit delta'